MLHGGTKPVATTVTTCARVVHTANRAAGVLRPNGGRAGIPAIQAGQREGRSLAADRSCSDQIGARGGATSVNVTAGLETVQTTSPEISTTVTAEQIERLPVGDRNPLAFISTQAGVSPGERQRV